MPRDLICVYYAASLGQADIIVAWLASRGIEAQVKDAFAVTTFQTSLIAAPRGIEVCVMNPDQAEDARSLLQHHFDELKQEAETNHPDQTVHATCEECGQTLEFSAAAAGTVQTCSHCGEYLDVPQHP